MSPNEDNKLGMPNMNALCSRKCWDCIKMMRLDGQVCMIPVPPAAHPEKQTIEPVKWYSTPHGHSNSIISITVRSWVKVGVGDGQKLGSLEIICNGVYKLIYYAVLAS